jgi:hypothetical protein
MRLETEIVLHATDEAKKKWGEKEKPVKRRKCSCYSCEIEELKKENKNDYNNKEKDK